MAVQANDLMKQAEDALAIEKESLAVVLRLIDSSVAFIDTEGRIVSINSAAEMLTGWTAKEAIGRDFGEVFNLVDEKSQERCADFVERVLRSGGISDSGNRLLLIARDGTEHLVTDKGLPIYNRYSNIVGAILLFRDITEKRKIETDLLKIQQLDSVSVIAGGIAHDFNNILTAIMGNISLAKMNANPNDASFARLVEVEKASIEARNLAQQLLNLSGGDTPVPETASIAELLRSSANLVLSGSNVRCGFFIQDDLWPVEVDKGQISQVVNNMIINADQAMPEGGTIEVYAENTVPQTRGVYPLDGRNCVKISIKDYGVGISEEYIQKIFDPYFTTKQSGSGLGLAVSYSIIMNYGGYIAVESQIGVGTTFTIYLPASAGEVTMERELEEQLFVGREKILVMDDDSVVRDLAREMLHNMGYRVTVARNGSEAIDLYRRARDSGYPFDAVIMDLTVSGGMGGKETIQKLTKIEPGIRAVVSSGYTNDPVMMNFREHGFSGAIAKPYRIKELSKVLHEAIG